MTEFYAVYLLLVLGILFFCLGLWKKYTVIFIFSAVSWVFAGVYFVFNNPTISTFVNFLGIVCMIFGVVNMFMPFIMREKILEPEEPEYDHRETIRKAIKDTSDTYRRTHRRRNIDDEFSSNNW